MSRPHNRKQQQKLQKAKSKREDARRKSSSRALQHTRTALLARALRAPFGPCWISAALEETPDAGSPALISVLVTRRVGGLLLPCLILVDRTCLGVKNAFTGPPQTELELERLRRDLSSSGDRLRETDLLTAQSVVHHAIDYANSLGFAPHRDFQPGLIGERPSALLDTPLARPDRPMYVSGPDDNVAMVLARLDASVGRGNYDVIDGDVGDFNFDDLDPSDIDADEIDADDPEILTVEGSEVPSSAPKEALTSSRP